MIKFKFSHTVKADSDGEFGLRFDVLEQDEAQKSVGLWILTFQASNGWFVKSSKVPRIQHEEKTVWIQGFVTEKEIMGSQIQSDINWFNTEAEMFQIMNDVRTALEEWTSAGGFDLTGYDTKEFSY